jgi:hypothetical protein
MQKSRTFQIYIYIYNFIYLFIYLFFQAQKKIINNVIFSKPYYLSQ